MTAGTASMAPPVQLPGFTYQRVDVDGVTINCATRGSGPPLLMLHGYPENHLIWRDVAPALADDHTVVLADLRGYGSSGKPDPDRAGVAYSKRAMARDQVGLMHRLGFDQFQVAGHDRGARVAHRLVLDHPRAVSRLVVLDIVPTRHVLHTVTYAAATANFHWYLLAVGNGIPEHLISADPDYWVRAIFHQLLGDGASIRPEIMDDYIRCFRDPATVAATCADFRSGQDADLRDDDEAFAVGQEVECPLLVLWGTQGMASADSASPLDIWGEYAADVRGKALPTGHFVPEEAPDLVVAELREFLS